MAQNPHTLVVVACWVGAIVDLGAAVLMIWPWAIRPGDKYRPSFDYRDAGFTYGMRYGASLMVGWTVLLLWAAADPVARRDVLLITLVPVVAGLMIVDAVASRQGILRPGLAWATRVLQVVLGALFVVAYLSA